MKKKLFLLLALSVMAVTKPMGWFESWMPKEILFWDWDQINPHKENFLERLQEERPFPKDFEWGVADSAYQVEGTVYTDAQGNEKCVENNWTAWEQEEGCIHEGQKVGKACDRWKRWKKDIQLMRESGFQAYRFSTLWSKINPDEGVFDQNAMNHYVEYVRELKRQGIKPYVCLFHHTWPKWFDEKGQWENPENIQYFIEYAKFVFDNLKEEVDDWMIINEPVGYALSGYFVGNVPPGKKDLKLAGQVTLNFLEAHVACYKAFKAVKDSVRIGFPHILCPIDCYHKWNPIEQYGSYVFDYNTNDAVLEFFKTGKFNWRGMKGTSIVSHENSEAPQCLDYIGVNYYGHAVIRMFPLGSWGVGQSTFENEVKGNNGMVLYPEGMYRAIQKCAALGKPMIVAENGVADNHDRIKKAFIRAHLYAIKKAIEDGYDVRGYHYWTLMDNWEWDHGYTHKFGLYKVDPETQERTPYEGSKEFLDFVRQRRVEAKASRPSGINS